VLDRPEVLEVLFHPRRQGSLVEPVPNCREIQIPVENDVSIGGRFHMSTNCVATLLFFHGNGEIAADYDELGPIYTQLGLNFLVVDYRGYGLSDGHPTVSAMLSDCHQIFDFVKKWLAQNSIHTPLVVMGRSLGSAPALELADKHADSIDGLIIESGFAYAAPLLERLGVPGGKIDIDEEKAFGNLSKINGFSKPTLIIHAEFDHIIPFSDGGKLFETSPAVQKQLLKIPHANHNDIFARGLAEYMAAVNGLINQISQSG
jgi:hypothetical protein